MGYILLGSILLLLISLFVAFKIARKVESIARRIIFLGGLLLAQGIPITMHYASLLKHQSLLKSLFSWIANLVS
jgi:hypothetical protein